MTLQPSSTASKYESQMLVFLMLHALHAAQLEYLRLDMGFLEDKRAASANFRIILPLPALTTLELAFLVPHATPTLIEFGDMVFASPHLATLCLYRHCIDFSQESSHLVVELPSVLSITLGGFYQILPRSMPHHRLRLSHYGI
jgi:hypothetical protein